MATLIIFGGLPGTGKTTIARELARRLSAVHVRIDSIEQAIRNSGLQVGSLDDAGYRAAYAIAEDNLRLGHTVIADSVNPLQLTRDAWMDVASRTKARSLEVEVICSDAREHRRRVESRQTDVAGLKLPTWADVVARDYEPWSREHIVIDTGHHSAEQCAETVSAALGVDLQG